MSVFNLIARAAMELSGACVCAVVDVESGSCLGVCSNDQYINIEQVCQANAQLIRSKVRLVREHALDSGIEDIMITLEQHYHLMRVLDTRDKTPMLLFYLIVDRSTANLVMARRKLANMEEALWRIPNIAKLITDASLAAVPQAPLKSTAHTFVYASQSEDDGEDELPPFMRDEVVLKLLGISYEETEPSKEMCPA